MIGVVVGIVATLFTSLNFKMTHFPASVVITKRKPTMYPDWSSVVESIEEFKKLGEDAFLEKYAGGRRPRTYYLVHEGERFPLKAVWAGAHRPTTLTREFDTDAARRGLRSLGFDKFWPDKISK